MLNNEANFLFWWLCYAFNSFQPLQLVIYIIFFIIIKMKSEKLWHIVDQVVAPKEHWRNLLSKVKKAPGNGRNPFILYFGSKRYSTHSSEFETNILSSLQSFVEQQTSQIHGWCLQLWVLFKYVKIRSLLSATQSPHSACIKITKHNDHYSLATSPRSGPTSTTDRIADEELLGKFLSWKKKPRGIYKATNWQIGTEKKDNPQRSRCTRCKMRIVAGSYDLSSLRS